MSTIKGNGNNNTLDGGSGADTIYGYGGDDTLNGAGGDDVLYGGDGRDHLNGGTGADKLYGGDGNDTIDGGDGIDTVLYTGATTGVKVDLNNVFRQHTGFGYDLITNVENVTGGDFNDVLRGTDGPNVIHGGKGDDQIHGYNGVDTLYGGDGNDNLDDYGVGASMIGGAGNDRFGAIPGEHIDGGSGHDYLAIGFTGTTGQTLDFSQSGTINAEDGTTITNIEDLNALFGSGDDFITGASGNCSLQGGDGNDTLTAYGSGNNILSGGQGDDTLNGAAAPDALNGGRGADRLFGSGGGDTFYFGDIRDSKPGNEDQIVDLTAADRISLSTIDADTTQPGDQAFTMVSSFTNHPGEATLIYHSGPDQTVLSMDVDGDGVADSAIIIWGDHVSDAAIDL